MKIINLLMLTSVSASLVMAEQVVVPDDYQINEDKELSYVYSDEYNNIIPGLKSYQSKVMSQFEKEFGYTFDTTMYVGLASLNNQITNGMATPIPFNSQLYYGTGSAAIDYDASPSWLKGLAIHETAHNYQLHPREKFSAKALHYLFGNAFVDFFGFPLSSLPTHTENAFIIEGNAVMNESRFGNGGRLYSGYALANVVSMALADKLKPEEVFNPVMQFPYGERAYLVGGFFQKFLVEKYGAEKTNAYFKTLSNGLFVFLTNHNYERHFSKSFEALLAEFSQYMKQKHQGFHQTQGKVLAKSQILSPLNSDHDEIMTLVSDNKSPNKVLKINKNTGTVSYKEGDWRRGEVFKLNHQYFTQTTAKVNANKIEQGLYDESLIQKKDSGSKVLQGVLPDGKEVYFDIASSIDQPQIYVDGKFYDTAHSSVYVSAQGDLYYFKQKGHTRTLYKNKKPLSSFEGNYGFVRDVDSDGNIYFIAKSEHGSTSYRYDGKQTYRVTNGDDVIDFKLLNESEALVATVGAEGITYRKVALQSMPQKVTATDYSLEDKTSLVTADTKNIQGQTIEHNASKPYSTLGELKYSYSYMSMNYLKDDGVYAYINMNFYDPLMRNHASLFLQYSKEKQIAGLSYSNHTSLLEYGASVFGIHDENILEDEQEYGYSVYMKYPFLDKGYWYGDIALSHSTDYNSIYRKPTTLSVNLSNRKHFGYSKLPYSLNALQGFVSQDRDALYYGATYAFKHDIGWQSTLGFDMAYMKSDSLSSAEDTGIYIADDRSELKNEFSSLYLPSLSDELYVKEAKKASLSLYKTFDFPMYFFTFPFSTHRQTLYAKQSYYDLDLGTHTEQYNETTLGLNVDLIILNNIETNLYVEMISNPDVQDSQQIKWGFSQGF